MKFSKNEMTSQLLVNEEKITLFSLEKLEKTGIGTIRSLPFSIKILLEQALRNNFTGIVSDESIEALASWSPDIGKDIEIQFIPSRVVLQDFTGVPAIVDLASLRSAMVAAGGDPSVINPVVPVDLIIDHSIQVDEWGHSQSLNHNMEMEFKRNRERYEFLKWGQKAFDNFRVMPPGAGIVHQINLEYLGKVVQSLNGICFPDTVVGTDSHTPMINGLGILGWGVGGIEAESVMLGQPLSMKMPQVVGFKLTGSLPAGATATDLVLRIVEMLREKGVVEKFVEFFGNGLSNLTVADRATIANMSPEYGATMGYFPVDTRTLDYLRATGRTEQQVHRVSTYTKAQGLFRTDSTPDPLFTETLELDLSTVRPCLAGPKRPQDRIDLSDMKTSWYQSLRTPISKKGFELDPNACKMKVSITENKNTYVLKQGSVVIAAITSCTNTSNPSVMIAAGLVAKKALEKGLGVKPWVKTSLAPGSRVVTQYLDNTGLSVSLDQLGFQTVGYGCTTCIGNSGTLSPEITKAIENNDLVVASVLSGNRNFEGRVNPHVKANYLASPPLVVAYALAGTVDIDLVTEPLGLDQSGNSVMLKDIWPTRDEITTLEQSITAEMYKKNYESLDTISALWDTIKTGESAVYEWDENSTYIRNPPFFQNLSKKALPIQDIQEARVLVKVGDSVTTDHISPAGTIAPHSPAGLYLKEKGISIEDFNSYGSRRGNDEVMTRGTFANIRLRNQLAPGTEGGITTYLPDGTIMTIFDASVKYKKTNTPLIVLAGKEYGSGSSRDWAAKGAFLLGIKVVIAASYERIHRSNLIGMGILPLQFKPGDTHLSLGLTGNEHYRTIGLHNDIQPGQDVVLKADDREIRVTCRLDTPVEIHYYQNGGILHSVLRTLLTNT